MPRSAGNFFLIIKDPRVCGGQRCRVSQGLVRVEEREREREISYGETARTRRTSRHLTRELACSSIPRNLEVLNFSIVGIESRRSIHTSLRYTSLRGSKTSIRSTLVSRDDEIHLEKIANIVG